MASRCSSAPIIWATLFSLTESPPLIRVGGPADNLSSAGHRYSNVDLQDPNFEADAVRSLSLHTAARRQRIFFLRLRSTNGTAGVAVRAAAVHPGGIQTELGRYADPGRIEKLVAQINEQLAAQGKGPFQWKTIPQGAATSVWAGVVAPADEIGGRYCENCHAGRIVPDNANDYRGQRRSSSLRGGPNQRRSPLEEE